MRNPIKLSSEKMKEIYTDIKLRNAVAFAHICCDEFHKFKYRLAMHPCQHYIVTDDQIAEAQAELQKAKDTIYENHKNDLLFACMGSGDIETSDENAITNYRVRTQFETPEGKIGFIELSPDRQGFCFINYLMWIEEDGTEKYFSINQITKLPYTKDTALQLVNKIFGCHFKTVTIDQETIHPDDRKIMCYSPVE